ncbi:MAG TPA: DUF2764 family protein [Candidatus Aminicenantes bacterium]|nr:DUF2764 family protein [Candidatus Aminicenantes bacterium]HNT31406.1 DUF2764 family protein [Candidatus Aminicenantes bacterium]HPH43258.1 DUF2764 family protein [Candidatus Aminicenantes bacterium]HPN15970.1 DUF2764 family protein [Candidatus Aminicenantes bacterium]
MGRYYYFASTLPALSLGAPPPLSSADFLRRGRLHLRPMDFALLEKTTLQSGPDLPPPAGSGLLDRYYAWERSLRNELVSLRAARLGRSGDRWRRPAGRDDDAARDARSVFLAVPDASTPLEAEIALESVRWMRIDRLRGLTVFDFDSLLAYRLQLLILERLAVLTAGRGERNYQEIYDAVKEAARTPEQTGETP